MMHSTRLKIKPDRKKGSLSFEAIGTLWEIAIPSPFLYDKVILTGIEKIIYDFDLAYSRFNTSSTISRAAHKKGTYLLPEDSRELMDIYRKLYEITSGLFTPLIGDALADAGYDSKYSFKEKSLKKVPEWEEVIDYTFPNLTVKRPATIDFGAAGKGYLIDIIAQFLRKNSLNSFSIDAGGDILCSNRIEDIGLEHPSDTAKVIGIIRIDNGSIASSSGNRRRWGRFHHIINPSTLSSPRDIIATWVTAKNAITADALATALFLVKPEILASEFDFEFLILYPDFKIKKSLHFDAELFYDNNISKNI